MCSGDHVQAQPWVSHNLFVFPSIRPHRHIRLLWNAYKYWFGRLSTTALRSVNYMKKQIYNITNEYGLQWAHNNKTFELETGIINQPFDDGILQIGEQNGTICGTFHYYDVVLLIILFRMFALDQKSF